MNKKIYPPPVMISIPAVNINLPVEETSVRNGIWQISEKGASHLDISATPGENGPIILYAHNTNNLFGPIRRLQKGDTLSLTTADNKTHTYTVTQTTEIYPKQTDIFFSQKGEALYLYTCDGFADLKRFVIIATPNSRTLQP